MQVVFRAQGSDTGEAFREICERRLAIALGRQRDLARVVIHLRDVSGPRGGEDVLCLLVAHVDGQPTLIVRALAPRAEDAVDLAATRLVDALVRQTDRMRRDRIAELALARPSAARRSS